MTEYTDKASQKSGKATRKGRPGKTRTPKGKRAKAPDVEDQGGQDQGGQHQAGQNKTPDPKQADPKQAESKVGAPDPATISFGSNRPIVATPHKVPEGSGLRFSGPSAGELKASGPQPNSAKASGLTFTNAKSNGGTANAKPESKKPDAAKSETGAKAESKTDSKPGAKPNTKPDTKPGKTNETSKVPASGAKTTTAKSGAKTPSKPGAKNAPLTKPAIAPQQSGRRLEKERSSSSFFLTLLGLVVAVAGLAFWMNGNKQSSTPREEVAAVEPAPQAQPDPASAAAPEFSGDTMPPPASTQPLAASQRAPETPGPLVGDKAPAATELTAAEIVEIQKLLDNLGLGPGNLDGAVTADTTAAIRAYQEMAGLPADGAANKALLEELRSVAELYGG